ncbi:unnamed protein product [Albugo candida]|uniref:Uncharacterized protein n=1 Tax=Albugo candida TaxID=65357 RepID=A0A024GE60_9STRA|nr:unnamed protein product [Albugo candida]|eukprot:CCI45048.1 unnamed protein product [Albugo candida]
MGTWLLSRVFAAISGQIPSALDLPSTRSLAILRYFVKPSGSIHKDLCRRYP